jgi:hypothetical protein
MYDPYPHSPDPAMIKGAPVLVLGTVVVHALMSMPKVLSLACCMICKNSASVSCSGRYVKAAWLSLQSSPC